MTDRSRCFVAVPMPDLVRAELASSVEALRADPRLGGLRWIDPDAFHITLAFLGAVETDDVAGIQVAVAEVAAAHGPMTIEVGGLVAFPSAGRARVLWLGATGADDELRSLADELRSWLGLDDASPFSGHVTVARAHREPVDLRPWLRTATGPVATVHVSAVELMRSHLGRGPARYETLASVELGMPARV